MRGRGRPADPRASRPSARWAATAGSASAGRRSTAARAAPTSSSSSSSTRRGGPAPRSRSSRSTPSAARSWSTARRSRSSSSCPKILAGELHFSIGYTEPSAGTDLASLTTRADKDGDEWVINGQKIYTSPGQLRRLHLAGRPHRPGRPEAQGHLDLPRAHHRPRVLVLEDRHDGERQHLQHLLRRRAGGRRRRRLRRQPGLGPHHQPAQLRAGVARAPRDGGAHLRGGPGAGPRPRSCPTAGGWSTRSGCSSTWPGSTPSSSSSSSSTGRWRAAGRRQPGRRQRHQGVRHRVLHGGLPPPDGDPRPGGLPQPRARPARCWPAASSGPSRAA